MDAIYIVNSMQKSLYDRLTFTQLVKKFQETATCPYLEPRFSIQNLFSIPHCLGCSKGSLLVRGFVENVTFCFFHGEGFVSLSLNLQTGGPPLVDYP
jgi:hypothetical protein